MAGEIGWMGLTVPSGNDSFFALARRIPVSRSITIAVIGFAVSVWVASCQSVAQVQRTASGSLSTATLHFPQRWYDKDKEPLFTVEKIEVRKLSSASGEFLFAALTNGDDGYEHEWNERARKPDYSVNSFAVDFTSNPRKPRVREATNYEWESATRIVTNKRYLHWNGSHETGEVEYRGRKYQKGGKYWGGAYLSPSGKWAATFSYTGERKQDFFMDGGSVRSGDIFWQVYDTTTGEKVFEWQAKDVETPTDRSGPIVWLEERYFLFPGDLESQKFIVVALPDFVPEKNPTTILLPPRIDANGVRVPAPQNDSIWREVVSITKEKAAEIAALGRPQIVGARSPRDASSRELLIAIREQTENNRRHQAARGRERSYDYNVHVLSTYYYAISLDDLSRSRFASKEEWEKGRSLTSSHRRFSTDGMMETPDGKHRISRPFPRTGASEAYALTSAGNEWAAIFSYTRGADADTAGKMFVDVFETRPGNKFSATEFPYKGSPVPLFDAAVWIEDDYLIVPLSTSFDQIVLWKLP